MFRLCNASWTINIPHRWIRVWNMIICYQPTVKRSLQLTHTHSLCQLKTSRLAIHTKKWAWYPPQQEDINTEFSSTINPTTWTCICKSNILKSVHIMRNFQNSNNYKLDLNSAFLSMRKFTFAQINISISMVIAAIPPCYAHSHPFGVPPVRILLPRYLDWWHSKGEPVAMPSCERLTAKLLLAIIIATIKCKRFCFE